MWCFHQRSSQRFHLERCLQKHLVKGQDVQDACVDIANLKEPAHNVREQLAAFGERLERTRERIEGAARLHHLLGLQLKADEGIQQEMERLAQRIGVPGLVEMCRRDSAIEVNRNGTGAPVTEGSSAPVERKTATAEPEPAKHVDSEANTESCKCWREATSQPADIKDLNASACADNRGQTTVTMTMATSTPTTATVTSKFQSNRDQSDDYESDDDDDEEEDHSKMADSGLGYCERCEGNGKMTRACSCQSFDDPTNASSKR